LGFFLKFSDSDFQKETSKFCRKTKPSTNLIRASQNVINLPITSRSDTLILKGSYMSKMKSVTSSNIKEVGYNERAEKLVVRFTSGELYVYLAVPEFVYKQFMSASSLGSFLNSDIKGNFATKKISESDLVGELGKPINTRPKTKVDVKRAAFAAMHISKTFPGAAVFF